MIFNAGAISGSLVSFPFLWRGVTLPQICLPLLPFLSLVLKAQCDWQSSRSINTEVVNHVFNLFSTPLNLRLHIIKKKKLDVPFCVWPRPVGWLHSFP